jgi:alpha-beta hydrolase superfamily lysophospholipase
MISALAEAAAAVRRDLVGPRYVLRTIRRFAWPEKAPSLDRPEEHGLPAEAFTVRAADGVDIRGWVLAPDAPEGVVILCHGRGANKSRLLHHMAMLHRAGFAAVAFDFRGCGTSDPPRRRWFNSMWEPLRDLEAVARYVEQRFGAAPAPARRTVLFGLSFGGNMAIAHAGTTGRSYAALVLDSTPLILWGGMLTEVLARERQGARAPRLRALCDRLAVAFVVAFTRADALYRHARFSATQLRDTPLLLILGERDNFFDIEESARFVERYYAGQSRVWRVRRGRHLTNHITFADAYEREVVSFLRAALHARSAP